ncbi:MAG: phospholipid/cholesterol/gamma-HCH transport system substrate-binding protein [Thermoleophilaceae bacterium]|nr:phospholipid/cholesterol/gamma-HCH transport system substrate-binding protein [Thermoleophilaceae bacterium]
MSLKLALKRYGIWAAAIVVMMILASLVAAYILSNQRITWPWQQFYEVTGQFENAQAVLPGRGQAVTISGVRVGEISRVELVGGVASVTARIEDKYGPVYRDAHMLLRPRTAAKDQTMALDPGTKTSVAVPDGGTLPMSSTAPDVNTDEVFSILDGDTRNYLKLMVQGLGEGLDGNGRSLRKLFESSQPNAKEFEQISSQLASRREQIARLVHNLNLVARATADRSQDTAQVIRSTAKTLEPLAAHDADLRSSLSQLPGTLAAAHSALTHGQSLATELEPTADRLQEPLNELTPALRDIRPALSVGTSAVRQELAPLVREALPLARDLGPIASDLHAPAKSLLQPTNDLSRTVNELVNDPPGQATRSYLYYLAWFAHNGASFISGQDAHGSFWRGIALFGCSDLEETFEVLPGLGDLLNLPDPSTLPGCAGKGSP